MFLFWSYSFLYNILTNDLTWRQFEVIHNENILKTIQLREFKKNFFFQLEEFVKMVRRNWIFLGLGLT